MLPLLQKKERPPAEEFTRQEIPEERREDERLASHAPLIISLFSSRLYREYCSMSFNHNRDGMCLEAPEPFKPGTVLYIRLDKTPADQIYQGQRQHLRTNTLGEVKWCEEFQDEFSTYYRIGIKYY